MPWPSSMNTSLGIYAVPTHCMIAVRFVQRSTDDCLAVPLVAIEVLEWKPDDIFANWFIFSFQQHYHHHLKMYLFSQCVSTLVFLSQFLIHNHALRLDITSDSTHEALHIRRDFTTRSFNSRAVFDGFQLFDTQSLRDLGLTETCETLIYQPLKCDNFTASLGSQNYHGSLGNDVLTASVCDASCGTALATFHRRIVAACASTPNIIPGLTAAAAIDSIWGGWNETCVKDTKTTKFCNGQ
jgi:hypothetical protein